MALSSIPGGGSLGLRGRSAVPMGTPLTTSTVSADLGVSPGPDSEVRVVVVDGRHDRRQLMSFVLEQADNVVVVGYADGPVTAVEAVGRLSANVVVLELQLPVIQGLDTVSALRDDYPTLAIIVCSFHASAATTQAALDRGADAYLAKPFSVRDLRTVLQSALHRTVTESTSRAGLAPSDPLRG